MEDYEDFADLEALEDVEDVEIVEHAKLEEGEEPDEEEREFLELEEDIGELSLEEIQEDLEKICKSIDDLYSKSISPKVSHVLKDPEAQSFFMDIDSLLLYFFQNPRLLIGTGFSDYDYQTQQFQPLHLTYLLETFLHSWLERGAHFKILLFEDVGRILWKNSPAKKFARQLIIRHLEERIIPSTSQIQIVDQFRNWWTDPFKQYFTENQPSFVLVFDAEKLQSNDTSMKKDDSIRLYPSFIRAYSLFSLIMGRPIVFESDISFESSFVMGFITENSSVLVKHPQQLLNILRSSCQKFASLASIPEPKNVEKNKEEEDEDEEDEDEEDYEFGIGELDELQEAHKNILTSLSSETVQKSVKCTVTTSLSALLCASILKKFQSEQIYEDLGRVFILHLLLKDNLSLNERSCHLGNLEAKENGDKDVIKNLDKIIFSFFSSFFEEGFALLKLLPSDGRLKRLCDVFDHRLFIQVLHNIMEFDEVEKASNFLSSAGDISKSAETLWKSISSKPSSFSQFSQDFGKYLKSINPSSPGGLSQRVDIKLEPFNNELIDGLFQTDYKKFEGSNQNDRVQNEHWGDCPTLLTEMIWSRTEEVKAATTKKKSLRLQQKFTKFMHAYAQSLEGTTIINPVNIHQEEEEHRQMDTQKKEAEEKPKKGQQKKKPQGKGKKVDMREKIIEEQKAKKRKEMVEKEARRWDNIKETLVKSSFEVIMKEIDRFLRTCEDPETRTKVLLFKLRKSQSEWKLIKSKRPVVSGKDMVPAINMYRCCNDIAELIPLLPSKAASGKGKTQSTKSSSDKVKAAKKIYEAFYMLGFESCIKELEKTLKIPFDLNKEDMVQHKVNMSSNRFELIHMGHLLKRHILGEKDSRVAFVPDPWQKQLLDIVDNEESAIVSAPTSSGKTFISYYAMKKVLKSKNGILVFVSPTKALVNQVAAQVYRLFGSGYYGVFTGDYRIRVLECRILITVPNCLEILLLSSLRQNWANKLQYIIFDEVHTMFEKDNGPVLERLLLLSPCPFLALSATVGEPEKLQKYLQDISTMKVEKGLKINPKVHLIVHNQRYADLQKHMYSPPKKLDENPSTVKPSREEEDEYSERLTKIHPCAFLTIDNLKELGYPGDLSFTPPDLVQLFDIMNKFSTTEDRKELEKLDPDTYFARNISRLDFLKYQRELKDHFLKWVNQQPEKAQKVLDYFREEFERKTSVLNQKDCESSQYRVGHLLDLLTTSVSQDKLPAIVFDLNRTECEKLAGMMTLRLEQLEEHKLTEKEKKQKQEEKAKAKMVKKALKEAERKKRGPKNADEDVMDQVSTLEKIHEYAHPDYTFTRKEYEISPDEFEDIIKDLYRCGVSPVLVRALFRGVGVHHSGLPKKYREAVERLFRVKHLLIVFATETLALGIHMPCRTVIFSGDSILLDSVHYRQMSGRAGRRGFDDLGHVVFYGFPVHRLRRLFLSDVSQIRAEFSLSASLILRSLLLFNQMTRSEKSHVQSALQVMLEKSLIGLDDSMIALQRKNYIRFSIQYLLSQGLLTNSGDPAGKSGLVAYISSTEPSNFLFLSFLNHGIFDAICNKRASEDKILEDLLLIICHIFHRVQVHPAALLYKESATDCPSMVVLPPLPDEALEVFTKHNERAIYNYHMFASSLMEHLDEQGKLHEPTLPLSKCSFSNKRDTSNNNTNWIAKNQMNSLIASPFVAISGKGDIFSSVDDMVAASNPLAKLNVVSFPIPKTSDPQGNPILLNAYAFDFFKHGQRKAIIQFNKIPTGSIYQMLKDFGLTLYAISNVLGQLSQDQVSKSVVSYFEKLSNQFNKQIRIGFS